MIGARIDHVAVAVKDLDRIAALYTQTLGFRQIYRETIGDQGVEALGLQVGDSVIELLRPLDEQNAVARWRGDHEARLHHIAYQVADLEAEIGRLKIAGCRMLDDTPRRGAHNNRIAFIHPSSTAGVLTELCQRAS
ncbi:MAG: methylmalonyl-CoA epimerase [Candidatus Eremiobacteraeota bacterium]|nr:methylmalonyl-CoA epimerase [Candidatus Eremiobacteraeota bacterium]